MAEGRLSFLDDDDTATPEVTAEAPAAEITPAPEAEPTPEPAPEQVVTGETAAPPAAVQEAQLRQVPIQVILDERDRRQAAEAELRTLRSRLEAMEAQRTAPKPIDLIEDPEGRLAHERMTLEQRIAAAEQGTTLRISRFLAEREYGADDVKAAHAFFDANPELSQRLLNHPSPYHAAVEEYRRHKLAQEIGTDPAAYRARLEAETKAKLMADQTFLAEIAAKLNAPSPATRPAVIPGSLASAPAAGRQEPSNIQNVPARLRGVI